MRPSTTRDLLVLENDEISLGRRRLRHFNIFSSFSYEGHCGLYACALGPGAGRGGREFTFFFFPFFLPFFFVGLAQVVPQNWTGFGHCVSQGGEF